MEVYRGSALNSLSTVTFATLNFSKIKDEKDRLKRIRFLNLIWLVIMIVPAYIFSKSEGSILENVVKVGSYFAGCELSIFLAAFYFPIIKQKQILFGTAGGFTTVLVVSLFSTISWPWYCLIGSLATLFWAFVSLMIEHTYKASVRDIFS